MPNIVIPLWKRPRRWSSFFLVCGAVGLFFWILPTDPSVVPEGTKVGKWTSILPPIFAVIVALHFRSLVWALSSAFILGTFLAHAPNYLMALPLGMKNFIWVNFTQQFNLYIFAFLFSLVGLIHVAYRSGGIHGLVAKINRVAKGPRSTKLATSLAGLAIFFDDYSNTVVVGSTMRALSDKWRISREKLAYIVDSTTAPIAGLALLSTWIAFEVFFFNQASDQLGLNEGGYEMFVRLIPYRFYCWGTLLFVFFTSALGRDFGPMYKAEKRAALEGKLIADGARLLTSEKGGELEPVKGKPQRWVNAVIPLAIVIGGTLGGILLLGRHKVLGSGDPFSFAHLSDWRAAFGMVTNPAFTPGGAMKILFFASFTGGVVAVVMAMSQKILTFKEAGKAYMRALPTLWMAFFILIMAWGMSKICTEGVHTDTYLISLLGGRIELVYLPLFVFLIASGMSFSTGTSFGTMAILIPVILPLAHALGAYEEGNRIIFWLTAAAIMDGAIFGDHCSPISDTTVLSSISAGCDHIDHVTTQMAYALTTMLIAGSVGYLAVASGMTASHYFLLFPAITVGILMIIGKKVPEPKFD